MGWFGSGSVIWDFLDRNSSKELTNHPGKEFVSSLMIYHDLSDLRSLTLIQIITMECTLSLCSFRHIIGWFSNRTGMSVDNGKAGGKDWTRLPVPNLPLFYWSSQLFNLYTPSPTDVPVLSLNQPISKIKTFVMNFERRVKIIFSSLNVGMPKLFPVVL